MQKYEILTNICFKSDHFQWLRVNVWNVWKWPNWVFLIKWAVYLRVIRPKTFSAFSACKLFIWWWWWRFVLIGLVAYNVACLRLTAPGFGNVGTHNKANTWKWKNTKIQKYKKTNTKHKMQIQNTDCKKKWKIYHLKKSGFWDFSGFSTFLNLFFSFFFAKSTRQKRPQKNPSRINAAKTTSRKSLTNQRGKNDLKKIPHATFFGDPNQRGKSDLIPDFLGAAGDKSPVLYREQGLWDAPPVELEFTSVIIIPRPADRGDAIYRTRATSFLQSMKWKGKRTHFPSFKAQTQQ